MSTVLTPHCVADLWKVFNIENPRFALDALRVANRFPTPASKINDVFVLLDDIWEVRGRLSRPIRGIMGVLPEYMYIYIYMCFCFGFQ